MDGWRRKRLGGWEGESHICIGGCLPRRVGRINAFVSISVN